MRSIRLYEAPSMAPTRPGNHRSGDNPLARPSGPSGSNDCAETIVVSVTFALWKRLQYPRLVSQALLGCAAPKSRKVVVARGNFLASDKTDSHPGYLTTMIASSTHYKARNTNAGEEARPLNSEQRCHIWQGENHLSSTSTPRHREGRIQNPFSKAFGTFVACHYFAYN